ncbi:MAG: hypothetical protein ACKO37_02295 [Vampirovibrionales bacterium]
MFNANCSACTPKVAVKMQAPQAMNQLKAQVPSLKLNATVAQHTVLTPQLQSHAGKLNIVG